MQNTIYTNNKEFAILKEGTYKSHDFIITTCGYYPAAYIKLLNQFAPELANTWDKFDFIKVHGGISFIGKCYLSKDEGHWIGWDYNCAGDYNDSYPYNSYKNYNTKKWTIKEIYEEIKLVIDQVIVVKDYALWKLLTDNHN